MKKTISILIFLCLVFFTGCGNGQVSEGTDTTVDSTGETSVQSDETVTETNETETTTPEETIIETEEPISNDIMEKVEEMNNADTYETPAGFDKKSEDNSYGELTQVEYYSETTGATRKCYVFTPPDYDPEKTYPVLYLLHGIGGTHTEWLGGAPVEILSNLIASGEVQPMIAVIPNVRAMKNDNLPPDMLGQENISAFDNFINDLRDDLMPFIKENYPVSDKRMETAIAGLSMGGRESLFIGVSMPDVFGYVGAFSPAPGLLPFSNLNYPGQLTAEEMTLPDEYKENTFMFICNGNQDGVVNNIPFEYQQVLTDNGVSHVYYTIDGGHDFGVWKNGLYHFVKNIF